MMNFFIGKKQAVTLSTLTGSGSLSIPLSTDGTICQVTPNLSLHQPHCSASGTADRLAHNVSISSCDSHVTTNEIADENSKPGTLPPLSAVKSCPSSWNSTVITEPAALPDTASAASG